VITFAWAIGGCDLEPERGLTLSVSKRHGWSVHQPLVCLVLRTDQCQHATSWYRLSGCVLLSCCERIQCVRPYRRGKGGKASWSEVTSGLDCETGASFEGA
jgi:hypothetical protein